MIDTKIDYDELISEDITEESVRSGKVLFVRVSKEDARNLDISKLDKAIFLLGEKKTSMGRLFLSFDYDDVAGFLFELAEVRAFLIHLTEKHPSLFFYLLPDAAAYEVFLCCVSCGDGGEPKLDLVEKNALAFSLEVKKLAKECGAEKSGKVFEEKLLEAATHHASFIEDKELLNKDLLVMDRPSAKVRKLARKNADPSKLINDFYTFHLGSRYWPDSVFIPKSVIDGYVFGGEDEISKDATMQYQKHIFAAELTAATFWKYTKVIYQFDPDLYEELVSTALPDDIPMSVFGRLPYFCVYIETPGLFWESPEAPGVRADIYGVYAYLCYDDKKGAAALPSLAVWLDMDGNFETMHFDLSEESVSKSFSFAQKSPLAETPILDFSEQVSEIALKNLTAILNLALYLCSFEEPSFVKSKEYEKTQVKSVKGGFKLFAPNEKKIIRAGEKEGEAIRKGRSLAAHEKGGKKRPHLRSAHWAGYWTGPRKDPSSRALTYNWIPPIFVNAYEDEAEEKPENALKE